jgi:hypothetical protein
MAVDIMVKCTTSLHEVNYIQMQPNFIMFPIPKSPPPSIRSIPISLPLPRIPSLPPRRRETYPYPYPHTSPFPRPHFFSQGQAGEALQHEP